MIEIITHQFQEQRFATMSSEMKIEDAISLLEETLEKSYCAYSKFPVACVLIAECGKTFTG